MTADELREIYIRAWREKYSGFHGNAEAAIGAGVLSVARAVANEIEKACVDGENLPRESEYDIGYAIACRNIKRITRALYPKEGA